MDETTIRAAILARAAACGAGTSFCPSEVARAISPDWRGLMPGVRAAAAVLAREGRLRVTRRGVEVDALTTKGPIRLAPQSDRR